MPFLLLVVAPLCFWQAAQVVKSIFMFIIHCDRPSSLRMLPCFVFDEVRPQVHAMAPPAISASFAVPLEGMRVRKLRTSYVDNPEQILSCVS